MIDVLKCQYKTKDTVIGTDARNKRRYSMLSSTTILSSNKRCLSKCLFVALVLLISYELVLYNGSLQYTDSAKLKDKRNVLNSNATVFPSGSALSCFRHNSPAWLNSTRIGNLQDPLIDISFIRQNFFDFGLPPLRAQQSNTFSGSKNKRSNGENGTIASHYLFDQSICLKNSRFLNTDEYEPQFIDNSTNSNKDDSSNFDAMTVRLWTVRLVYLAIHYHQYQPAYEEAKARLEGGERHCNSEMKQMQLPTPVNSMDFECHPSTKYLVVSLSQNGMGAVMLMNIAILLVAALTYNRNLVLISHAPSEVNDERLREPWYHASCPRRDVQCFFMPISPCVLTAEDLNSAHTFSENGFYALVNAEFSENDTELHNRRVWVAHPILHTAFNVPDAAGKRLHKYAMQFIDALPLTDPRLPVLKKAAEMILVPEVSRTKFYYPGDTAKLHHALAIYAMRPNPSSSRKLDATMKEVAPSNLKHEQLLGMPTRASDKCKWESDCLNFHQHLQLVSSFWKDHETTHSLPKTDPTVIFTTESLNMVQEKESFVKNVSVHTDFPYKFDFIINNKDVTPDSGYMEDVLENNTRDITADSIVLSSVATLKLQLHAHVTMANCCSHYHRLLRALLLQGCGAAYENHFYCMQDTTDWSLMACCGWTDRCTEQKKAYMQTLLNSKNEANNTNNTQ